MKTKIFVAFILLVGYAFACEAQSDSTSTSPHIAWNQSKRNAAYLEILGGISVYSLNYQKIARSRTNVAFTYRVGASYVPGFTTLTGYVGGVYGKPSGAFELLLGAGYYGVRNDDDANVNFPETKNHNLYLAPQLGYRFQKLSTGFLLRLVASPWVYVDEGLGTVRYTPGFGLSLGKTF